MSGKAAILRAMHVVVAEGPGILLTNSPGWDFMSEVGLARGGSNKASRQNSKSNAWFIISTKNVIFSDLTHWLIDSFDSKKKKRFSRLIEVCKNFAMLIND